MSNDDGGHGNDQKQSLNVACIGCGQIVTHHVEAMATSSSSHLSANKIVIRALCDPSKERRQVIEQLASNHKLLHDGTSHHYALLDDLINDTDVLNTIDVLFIAVPHDLHETLCMQALSTNKIVVMEKPLAPTRDGCDRLVQVSSELSSSSNGAMLIVAEQSPYWQEVAMARRLIGTFGLWEASENKTCWLTQLQW